ncbi:MAG: tRNA (guanosine(46)-N7)-methyltransferase TrmB, partial [Muribaculaceae bacterium]|nr:tRNA (guanosine(46)-N7)-methyltransferase TrmB [Muribaculaceae bacterium]
MGKNKLKKFAEIEQMDHVFQFPFARLESEGFPLKGNWHMGFFNNNNPIVIEIGCGRGEYTVGLARRFPDRNFIGIDIKGARIHAGAKQALIDGLKNVAFLRTNV